MNSRSMSRARHDSSRKLFSGLGVIALSAGVVNGGVAAAAPETFNPFAINQGFTIVSQGDVMLNNGELEGSVAAFDSARSGNPNGFTLLHSSSSEPDYEVPRIDDVPVRLLAAEFVGSGSFDISNRDDSGVIAQDSPEANAVAKLGDVDDLIGSPRSGGTGEAAGQEFLRASNGDGGFIDVKSAPFESSDVSDLLTDGSPVSSYFGDVDAQVEEVDACLETMYDPALGLTNEVTVSRDGNQVVATDFSTTIPNVVDYGDIAGLTIKMDQAEGYQPTPQAPLIIRVAPGTETIGPLDFEGWDASAGAQQSYARYMMLDLSVVTGDTTIDGLSMGAIWAPHADLTFESGITTNGQWFAGDVTTSGGGEIHHHTFDAELPCGADPTPAPTISTDAQVVGSDDNTLPLDGGTVIDTVDYEGLDVGREYELIGQVRTSPDGDDTGISAGTTFTPDAPTGSVEVRFDITAVQATTYAGRTLVIYEQLSAGGTLIAEHADPTDPAQMFTVADPTPSPPEPTDTPLPPEPTEPSDPPEPTEPPEPSEPTDVSEPTDASEPAEGGDPTDPTPGRPGATDGATVPDHHELARTGPSMIRPLAFGALLLLVLGVGLLSIRQH